ncbi:hypothetical protein FNV43_RR17394 [Rhamnella rubrinervis]|uniref:MADS-box domain-containing protein n=1 Tax=Rhamnella rubrinervis TaxID=2594499 RepID=A0A8K0GUT3_9ROSA|nr:hypothetical protein FNV43_RR17394 [Rhamnella rubrinervis]
MTNKGNKRNKMKMIQGTDSRQAALPKPRSDLFKRASELCTLCAVETALVIFSPSGSNFFFGHPFVNSATFKRCQHEKLDAETIRKLEARQEAVLRNLHKECADLHDKIEAEKKRGKKLELMNSVEGVDLFDKPIESLSLQQLLLLKATMEDLKLKVVKHRDERLAKASTSSSAENPGGAADLTGTEPAGGNSSAGP